MSAKAKADLNSSLPFPACPKAYSANGSSNGFEKHLPFMEDLDVFQLAMDLTECKL